jgi:hypothetical protein
MSTHLLAHRLLQVKRPIMSVLGRENPFLLTRPELLSAKRKIAQVAAGYDPLKTSFKGFESHSLDPTTFREQIRQNLLISLTNAELGALVTLLDKVFCSMMKFHPQFLPFRTTMVE